MADRIGQQFGLYRLIRLIGTGGFAEVYLGEHVRMLTQAVVKVFQTQLAPDEEERFGEEARAVSRLGHPHIMPVSDGAAQDGTPYVVMDYAPHGTLRQFFPRGTPQSPGTLLPYIWQVADALHFAHSQRALHRNVKPENMLLDANKAVLLSDFSIPVIFQSQRYQAALERAGAGARAAGESAGATARQAPAAAGAAAYLAPEYIRGQAIPASDQYALAAIIYEWLSGSPPFRGTMTEVMAQHLFAEPQPLRERVRALSPAIEAVVLGALSKDPDDRFPSVESFARAFEAASQAVPVLLFVPPVLLEPAEPDGQPISEPAPVAAEPVPAAPEPPPLPSPTPATPGSPFAPESPASQPIILGPPAAAPSVTRPLAQAPAEAPEAPPIILGPPSLPPTPPPAAAFPPPQVLPEAPPAAPIVLSAPSGVWAARPAPPTALPTPAFTVPGRPRPAEAAPAPQPPAPFSQPMPAPPLQSPAPQPPTLDASWREVNWMPAQPQPAAPAPPSGGVSRRAVLLGGVAGLIVVGGGLAWLGVNALVAPRHSPGSNAGTTPPATRGATPTPTATPVPRPGDTLHTYHGHTGFVRGVCWSPDGTKIASASDDGTVQVWDAFSGTQSLIYKEHAAPVMSVAWSPDGTMLASGGQDKALRVWSASTAQTLHTYTFGKAMTAVAWSPNGAYLAAASEDETIGIWRTSDWLRLHRFGAFGAVNAVSWSPDNIHIVSGDAVKQAIIWNVVTGGKIRTYRGHTSAILALAWAPAGTGIASGADLPDTTVQYWSNTTLKEFWSVTMQAATQSLAWSPGGMQLAVGGSGVTLLNSSTQAQMLNYQGDAAALGWSPNGTYIASGGQSTTVQVWKAT